MQAERVAGSFRDPSGFVFRHDDVLYRQINPIYRQHYDQLIESGLASDLIARGYLISHEEIEPSAVGRTSAYKILRPERIPFISYPYEWSFSQLKDAALLTLGIQRRALKCGMSMKDASAYNIQFLHGRPILIDTLSFEVARPGQPWVAYRQFCQHFLAPLALMAHRDVRLSQLLKVHLDGIPLDLASSLLPRKTWLSPSLLMHLHVHASAQKRYSSSRRTGAAVATRRQITQTSLMGILDSLATAIKSLRWQPAGTEWVDYYHDTNYSESSMREKERLVDHMMSDLRPSMLWDLGANVGRFSRLASGKAIETIAFDVDPGAVERNYLESSSSGDRYMLPLVADLTNPSGDVGWAGTERLSLEHRGPADTVLALALVHHLAIGNNVPFPQIAEWFSHLTRTLIIEYVPKSDSQVQRMLSSRADIFDDYTQASFERAFETYFAVVSKESITDTDRVLYRLAHR
jgi:hypothetical protein